MSAIPVHVAVFDPLADWETGYATAHIRSDQWQREPGRYSVCTVGPAREPVTTMGGLSITPDMALGALRPQATAMLILPGGDPRAQDTKAAFLTPPPPSPPAAAPRPARLAATLRLPPARPP